MNLTKKQLNDIKQRYRLSPRETELMDLLFQGVDSNSEIADRLNITLGSAKVYVHNLYAKIGKNTKLAVVLEALHYLLHK